MSNLQEIKDLVSIRAVADYLGLEEEYGKRKFPGERTASIQLYKDNRFHDFGRNVNGDIFDLSKNRICEGDFGIAEYASPERAKEVLNDMFQKYAAGEKIYIMPEE